MSVADEARDEAEKRWPIPANYLEGDKEHTLLIAQRQAYVLGRLDEASRKPEAAASDTDREALIKVIRMPTKWRGDRSIDYLLDEEDAAAVAVAVLAAGFSRSQPVQVEVTPEVGDAITVQGVIVGLNHPYDWANIRFKNGTVANVPLSAALGGGDHAE